MRDAADSLQAGAGLPGDFHSLVFSVLHFNKQPNNTLLLSAMYFCDNYHLQAPVRPYFCGEGVRKGASDLFLLWQRVSRQAKVAAARREKKLSWGAQNHLPMQPLWKDFHKEGQP